MCTLEVDAATAYVAFRATAQPRIDYITKTLSRMKTTEVKLLDTSFLYATTDGGFQPKSHCGVVKITTSLAPFGLLRFLNQIVDDISPTTTAGTEPRKMSFDVLFYEESCLSDCELTIAYAKITTREFVLRPLLDLWKGSMKSTLQMTREQLVALLPTTPTVRQVMSLWSPNRPEPIELAWGTKTYIMGILNVSPDSFFHCTDDELTVAHAKTMEGVDFIDIGAVSRRPGTTEAMSTENEIRTLTLILRQLRDNGLKVPISVDVFKASVAEAAIDAGADIINDVGMCTRDRNMILVAAAKQVPIIIMHTRGSAADMQKLATYEKGNVTGVVLKELQEAVEKAIAGGVFRWNIILDPGIGFAKTGEQDLELLQNLHQFRAADSPLRGYPLLIGCCKKEVIRVITGEDDPRKLGPGTLASTAALVSAGTDIIRVHDVADNIQAVKFSDAFWRKK